MTDPVRQFPLCITRTYVYFVESDFTVGAGAQIDQLDVTSARSMSHTTRGTADAQTVRSHRHTL